LNFLQSTGFTMRRVKEGIRFQFGFRGMIPRQTTG